MEVNVRIRDCNLMDMCYYCIYLGGLAYQEGEKGMITETWMIIGGIAIMVGAIVLAFWLLRKFDNTLNKKD